MLSPGDRVRLHHTDRVGVVVEVHGFELLVEMQDGERRIWQEGSVQRLPGSFAPRGEQSVPDRARAAARLVAEGASVADVARDYGVVPKTVHSWLAAVRLADREARLAAAGDR